MRFSVEPTSPAYHPAVHHMAITLNGVKVTKAVEVDDTAGTVLEIVGYDQQAGKNILQTRRGVIRITVPHEHSFYEGWPKLPDRYVGRPVFTAPRGFRRFHTA